MTAAAWQCPKCRHPLVGHETTCPNCGTVLTPQLAAPPSIHVRKYASVAQYQVDVGQMTASGWTPIAQTEAAGGLNQSWALLGVLVAIGAILFWYPALVIALLLLILAAVNGRKSLVVTYQRAPATPG